VEDVGYAAEGSPCCLAVAMLAEEGFGHATIASVDLPLKSRLATLFDISVCLYGEGSYSYAGVPPSGSCSGDWTQPVPPCRYTRTRWWPRCKAPVSPGRPP
jgi:hypothetical protein